MTNRTEIRLKAASIHKNQFEMAAWAQGHAICGIDEVGRGCLAGPVVTAAVILPPHSNHELLRDSKTMSEAQRLTAYAWIVQNAWYGVGIINHRIIDERNIWHATLIAMKKAFMQVAVVSPLSPQVVVIDAMPLSLSGTSHAALPIHYFCKGESLSVSIAAASIVAKVQRDALMTRMNQVFPGYHFADHKGYATKKHQAALIAQPPSLIHRTTFLRNTPKKESHRGGQQTIC